MHGSGHNPTHKYLPTMVILFYMVLANPIRDVEG